jgi:acetylxylan esterase
MLTHTIVLSLLAGTLAIPVDDLKRQSCPAIHIFGARETTASPGYGSAGTVVNYILNAHPGSTAEAINYPASGSNPSYSESVREGTAAVVSQVSSFASRCPNTELVLVGYSQVRHQYLTRAFNVCADNDFAKGAEIFDNALCGGGDPNQGIYSTGSIANYNIKAAIFMGDPRFRAGAPYNVGK